MVAVALAIPSASYPSWGQDPAPPLPPLRRSVSATRQFVVYAHDGALRAALSQTAEETKAALLRLLDLRDDWRLPIVLHLVRPIPGSPGEVPPSRLVLAQTGAGLKVQLDLRLRGSAGDEPDRAAGAGLVRPRDEIVRALLLEIAYRDRPELPAGRAFQLPPAWLVEGCAAAVENAALLPGEAAPATAVSSAETRSAMRVAATMLTGSGASGLSVETFLNRDPASLDSPSRGLYRACAFGLVHLLTHEAVEGRAGLTAFLRALPSAQGEAQTGFAALRWGFPSLGDAPGDLQRRLAATLTRLASEEAAFEICGLEETERRLATLLVLRAPLTPAPGQSHERVGSLEEFPKFLKPGKRHARENAARLANTRAGLLALGARAHPAYREIVAGYEAVVVNLSRGAFDGAAARLRALAAARAEARTRQEAVADYLNWFEATQLNTPSGAFEPYFQMGRDLGRLAPRSRRTDTISTYLDGIEHEFR